MTTNRKAFFTMEDAKISFNLFCAVCGIGTLGMPANFSRAGPVIAVCAMIFMAFANIYASVVCSKVMMIAPRSVRTFGDLGEWCVGKPGRWLVTIAQMGVCLLAPCAFLVLGGVLLDGLFPEAFKDTTWIVLMALSCVPICLTPTLKEGAAVAFAGCMGTVLSCIVGSVVLLSGMKGHPSVPQPNVSFEQVAVTFGNLSLAYGAGVVIPALQRQHSEPTRMPRVIIITLSFISVLFLALAVIGYTAVGCQIQGNLLFSIYSNPTSGLTDLGFKSNWGGVVLAYMFMQLHIQIAFSVLLHPAFYIFERLVLGMHQHPAVDVEAPAYEAAATPNDDASALKPRASKSSVVSMADIERVHDDEEDESAEYKGYELKYITLRMVMIAVLTAVAMVLKDHFNDLADFIGASAHSYSCIILPIVFYLRKMWPSVPTWEKTIAMFVIVICVVLSAFVSYKTGKKLFVSANTDGPKFPFCEPEFQYELYYNASAVNP
ncbi:hypothetical protein P43SY_005383 [Pythium insidiosum]|uniref:Amino acid transporter transmembrane domain-containing protein n=1 Tax=Pythium insidiosum TaxID=114742 RepID=A0AAD5M217_PYTIN|nr:hypothetical protein P43SY_005383 [Pythium insidiosum]KAJ0404338.1 hypothetical protein ATCC90586_007652 [Pythium insidiosum]